MTSPFYARPARSEDKAAILAFCQNTFSWGDYIADVWDGWLNDSTGCLIVGQADGQAVGVLHAQPIEGRVVWIEGLRVHPDFRRQGISSAMERAAREWARAQGYRFTRLVTSVKNVTAQQAIAAYGYHCIARFGEWDAPPQSGEPSRIALPSDDDTLFAQWGTFPPRVAGQVLLPNRDWRWSYLTRARMNAALNAGEVRTVERGWMLVHHEQGDDWSALIVHALVGDGDALRALALAARAEAGYRGFQRVELIVADHSLLNNVLTETGYNLAGGMLVYEQILE